MKWQIKNLGDICEILDNKRKPITKRDRSSGKYPYYGATGIQDYISDFIFNEKLVLIGEDGAKWLPGEYTAFIADGKYWVNNHAHVIRPNREEVMDNWIVYYLYLSDLTNFTTGLTVPKLNQANLRTISIPLPPIAEQQRILKILDEAFEKLETVTVNTQRNLQCSKDIFKSYLDNIFDKQDGEWSCSQIEKHIRFIDYRGRTPKKTSSGIRLITAKNIKMGYLKEDPKEFINPDDYDKWMTRGIPELGDILFTTEAPLGNIAQINTTEKLAFAQRTIIFQPDKEYLDKNFLKYLLQSSAYQQKIKDKATGATVQGIKASLLKKINICYPSLEVQRKYVHKLDILLSKSRELENIYIQKQAQTETLKKSILSSAFSGNL